MPRGARRFVPGGSTMLEVPPSGVARRDAPTRARRPPAALPARATQPPCTEQTERRVRTLGWSARQALRLLHAAGGLWHASGRLRRAEVEQDRPPHRGRHFLLERAAKRSHRLVRRAAVAGLSCRSCQRIEGPLLANGAGGARGQQVGGHTLTPSGVSRELTSGGQMQPHTLGRRDRVVQRLVDDRMDEPRRKARIKELGVDQGVHRLRCRLVVHARDLRGVRQGGVVAEDRQRPGHGPGRWRASLQPSGTNRATDGGPMAAIVSTPTSSPSSSSRAEMG